MTILYPTLNNIANEAPEEEISKLYYSEKFHLCIKSRNSNEGIDNIGKYISIWRWICIPVKQLLLNYKRQGGINFSVGCKFNSKLCGL